MKRTKLFLLIGVIICIFISAAFFIIMKKKDQKNKPELPPGRWNIARYLQTKDTHDETFKKLIGLGYLEGYKPATASENVTVFNKDFAYPGLNFFVSGHGPEAILMDMEGKVLHTWHYRTACEIWKNFPCNDPGASNWRRAHLFKNGDVLAIHEGIGLIKLDKDSHLLWSYTSSRAPHHDLEVVENGNIYILTMEKKKIPRISKTYVYDEFISILSPEGKLREEFSLIDFIENSPYAQLLDNDHVKEGGFYGHILHTNTIEVFDGSLSHTSPLFKKGNVLLSLLIPSTIAIVDIDQREVVWALGSGMWKYQHQPTLLHNGNTLITETDSGRAFEVTPHGTIVWEYINPFRAGKKKELIASLFEMTRINPAEYDFAKQ